MPVEIRLTVEQWLEMETVLRAVTCPTAGRFREQIRSAVVDQRLVASVGITRALGCWYVVLSWLADEGANLLCSYIEQQLQR